VRRGLLARAVFPQGCVKSFDGSAELERMKQGQRSIKIAMRSRDESFPVQWRSEWMTKLWLDGSGGAIHIATLPPDSGLSQRG
jgi:hypothetical protein